MTTSDPGNLTIDQLGPASIGLAERAANALGRFVQTMRPERRGGVAGLLLPCDITLEDSSFGGVTMREMTAICGNGGWGSELITAPCSQCGAAMEGVMRFFAPNTACQPCCDKWQEKEHAAACKQFWEKLVPINYRETDPNHAGFPKAIWQELRQWDRKKSLFLYGESGSGKTRLAFMLAKRALYHGATIGVLWPWDLEDVKNARSKTELIQKYGNVDLLIMDDPLLTGAHDDRITTFLKNLIEYRNAHNRTFIVTSQLGGVDYKQAAGKFGLSKADVERVEAIMRRLDESCELRRLGAGGASDPLNTGGQF